MLKKHVINQFLLMVAATLLIQGVVFTDASAANGISGDRAKKIYQENCSVCHGDKGDGQSRASGGLQPPPRDFTTLDAALELDRARMIKSVTDGRPGTAMVGHRGRLSEDEISAVVDFVRTNFMKSPIGENPVAKHPGRKLYEQNCAVCHGDKGNTAVWAQNGLNPPPRNFTNELARQELTTERMVKSVTEGRPGTAMMSFTKKLSAKEIQLVVNYIQVAFMQGKAFSSGTPSGHEPGQIPGAPHVRNAIPEQPHRGASPLGPIAQTQTPSPLSKAEMALPFPKGIKGDLNAGKTFYMGNCFVCHGVEGKGDGPRAYFNVPRPRDFTSEQSRQAYNRPRLFAAISHGKVGTVMPAWQSVLSDQEIANVAEFVWQAYIQGKSQLAR